MCTVVGQCSLIRLCRDDGCRLLDLNDGLRILLSKAHGRNPGYVSKAWMYTSEHSLSLLDKRLKIIDPPVPWEVAVHI